MITLYYVPKTRASRARWMLEELGVPYQLHRVDTSVREQRSAEYLANVHPLGHVPVLVDGETRVFESGAIVAYLADRFPDKGFAPAPGTPERGQYYQWLFYAATELEPHAALYFAHNVRLPEEQRVPAVAEAARHALNANLAALETALADGREFLVGGRFSAADLYVCAVVGWAGVMRMLGERPLTKAWSKRIGAREAAVRANAD